MGFGYVLLLVGVAGSFFGCGMLCGHFLFRNRQVISLTLPDSTASFAKPFNDLQNTLSQIVIGVRQHGQRLTEGAGALKAPSLPTGQAKIIHGIIEANRGFERQANVWADDVRRTSERLTQSVQPQISASESDRQGNANETTPDPQRRRKREEQRSEKRHPFFCLQWIAPYNGYRAPDPDEFFRVQCRDIASSGISFFVDRVPYFELVVIRLPGDGVPKYLTARIQRVKQSANCEFGAYTVGCVFLGSLHASAFAPHLEGSIKRREKQAELEVCAI